MIHKWVLQMGVNHLFLPKHHRPKLVRPKEPENVVLFHLVREELAELEEYVLLLALEVGLHHRYLNIQLMKEYVLLLALEVLALEVGPLKHQLLIANVVVVVVVSVRTEVKEQKLDLLP